MGVQHPGSLPGAIILVLHIPCILVMVLLSSFSLLFCLMTLLVRSVASLPLQSLERRASGGCKDKKGPPCVCNDQFGLRRKNIECPGLTFSFIDPLSTTDGTLKRLTSNLGISDLQCDHIVELQFVAARITPDMCGHFEKSPQDLSSFFAVLNGKKNLVDLPARVNGAKGVLFGGKSFDIGTTRKDAAGVASFFGLITTDAEASAIKINEEMEKIMGKGKGFTNFVKEYMNKVKVDFPTKIQKSLPQLSPASIPPAPGSNDLPVINETDAVIERCKAGKRSFQVWPMVRNLARQVSGKKISPEDCKQTCVVTTPKTSTNKSTAKASTKEAAKPPTSDRNAKPPQAKPATKPPPRSPVKPAAKAPVKKLAPKARRGSITSLD